MQIELSYFPDTDSEEEDVIEASDQEESDAPPSDYQQKLQRSIAEEKLKTELFSNISHEFKTPINIILSSIDLLKLKLQMDNPAHYEESYAQYLHYTEQNCYKLLRLVSDLLDSTKLEHRSLQLLTSQCEIKSFIQNTLRCTETFAESSGIEIYFNTDIEGPCYLNCDRDRVDRILLNLLSNSIKHTPRGGTVSITLTQDPDYVYISVRDTGDGIPKAFLPYIFDKFQTCSDNFIKKSDGTGLGLSIAKGLVELHQGIITAESAPGEGATFTFSLSRHLPHSMSSPLSQFCENENTLLHPLPISEIGYFDLPCE